jgi:hypothetical protein
LTPEERLGPRFELVLPGSPDETTKEYGDDPLAHVRELGARFVVVQHVGERFRFQIVTQLRKQLREHAKLVARYTPLTHDDGSNANLEIRYVRGTLARPFVRAVFESHRMGPTLEVYELTEPDPASR